MPEKVNKSKFIFYGKHLLKQSTFSNCQGSLKLIYYIYKNIIHYFSYLYFKTNKDLANFYMRNSFFFFFYQNFFKFFIKNLFFFFFYPNLGLLSNQLRSLDQIRQNVS